MSSTPTRSEHTAQSPNAATVDMKLEVVVIPVSDMDHAKRFYGGLASFNDPDGNGWVLQEIKTRLPGRGLSNDVGTLTELLREAEERHGNYEATAPKHHWSGWYAAYIVAREQGKTPDEAAKGAALHMEGTRR